MPKRIYLPYENQPNKPLYVLLKKEKKMYKSNFLLFIPFKENLITFLNEIIYFPDCI